MNLVPLNLIDTPPSRGYCQGLHNPFGFSQLPLQDLCRIYLNPAESCGEHLHLVGSLKVALGISYPLLKIVCVVIVTLLQDYQSLHQM